MIIAVGQAVCSHKLLGLLLLLCKAADVSHAVSAMYFPENIIAGEFCKSSKKYFVFFLSKCRFSKTFVIRERAPLRE